MSRHVFEGDVGALPVLVEEFGLALAHAEHAAAGTAAHAAHHEEPQEHEQYDGQETAQQAQEEAVALAILHLALEVLGEVVVEAVDRAIFSRDGGLLAHAVGACLEHFAYVFGAYRHAHLAGSLVDDDFRAVVVGHVGFERGVVHLFVCSAAAVVALEEHEGEGGNDRDVEPAEAELRHVVFLAAGDFIVVCIHYCLYYSKRVDK